MFDGAVLRGVDKTCLNTTLKEVFVNITFM